MIKDQPSSTALGDCFIRAAHVALEPEPLIEDPISRRLLHDAEFEAFTASVLRSAQRRPGYDPGDLPGTVRRWMGQHSAAAPHVLLRTRFAEDRLAEVVEKDQVTQYAVLAAGMDTFALRRSRAGDGLTVLEFDLPATQQAKRERIAAASLSSQARYCSGDLEEDRLAEILAEGGSSPDRNTFASFCGVTYYLSPDAVLRTLRALRAAFRQSLTVVADSGRHGRAGGDCGSRGPHPRLSRRRAMAHLERRWRMHTLWLVPRDQPYAVWVCWDQDWRHLGWYVNFQAPLRRSARGWSYMDWVLDLRVTPDGTATLKDEAYLDTAIELDLIPRAVADDLRGRAKELTADAAGRRGLFEQGHTAWRPDPSWPVPRLPIDWQRDDS